MFIAMLAAIERSSRRFDLHTLRLCICGGAPLDRAIQDRWFDATGVELRQGYGLTEASPVALFNAASAPNGRGTLGTPFPGVEVAIRDPATFSEVPDGGTGEICVRGDTVFGGYVASAEEPAPRGLEVRDGWLRTGDLGARLPDGSFVFRGLHKDMFTRNGFNIYPKEIERAVREHRGVATAAVTAHPNPQHDNDIVLSVAGSISENDVRDWCERRLSAYKQPTTILVTA